MLNDHANILKALKKHDSKSFRISLSAYFAQINAKASSFESPLKGF